MAKDERIYAKFCVDFADHYKIACLSDKAFRTLMEMILWSRRHLTDGFVPKRMVVDDEVEANVKQSASFCLWSASACFDLLHNDDEKPSLLAVENGYMIHDFAKHQTTTVELEAKREVKKRAGRMGGIASGQSRREAKRSRSEANSKKSRSKTKPETETETDLKKEPTNVGSKESRSTGTRLPAGWQPAPDVVAQLRADHPDLNFELEHAKFVDYWRAKSGKDATKLDWNATWRNWIRRSNEQQFRTTKTNGHPLENKIADYFNDAANLAIQRQQKQIR